MKVTITLDDPAGLDSVRAIIEPPLNILEKAAKVDAAPTVAQTYAMGALNAMKDFKKDPNSVWLPRARNVKPVHIVSMPVNKVSIVIEDTPQGGALCKAEPSFAVLMSMVAGQSKISQVHQYALVCLSRVLEMGLEAKAQRQGQA